MLWTPQHQYHSWPFDKETELESTIAEVKTALFGESRIYLELKKLIGERGKTQNIPDGYLIDLSSPKKPVLYLVEVELAKHDPLRHIAQQLLNFSLSFKSTPQKMKGLLREHLLKSPETVKRCEAYAQQNGFSNLDYLLEQMIYPDDAFNCLVIIDELEDELESILRRSLAFPVETLTLQRFRASKGGSVYQFEPFLYDLSAQSASTAADSGNTPAMDPAEIDTVVVPAHEEGFREVFLSENRWHSIRIHSSMREKIKYLATPKWPRTPPSLTWQKWPASSLGKTPANTCSISKSPQRRSALSPLCPAAKSWHRSHPATPPTHAYRRRRI